MTYTLDLFFTTGVSWTRVQEHFAARNHYAIDNYQVTYEHPETGTTFFLDFEPSKIPLVGKRMGSAEFTLNYGRPSYFGIEAEIELSAFIAVFKPRIHDPQMYGMSDGPYSTEGFLRGWNFGNQFAVSRVLASQGDPDLPTLPMAALRKVWAWNYAAPAETHRLRDRRFVPSISFILREDQFRTCVIWPTGMPISLPHVDYVFIGFMVDREKRVGLVPWAEVVEILNRARFDTTKDPIEVEYFNTPEIINRWIASIPEVDMSKLSGGPLHGMIDEEILAAARAMDL